jgi:hypothetical protein
MHPPQQFETKIEEEQTNLKAEEIPADGLVADTANSSEYEASILKARLQALISIRASRVLHDDRSDDSHFADDDIFVVQLISDITSRLSSLLNVQVN